MTAIPTPLKMMGAPGSPYTRKMRSLLRYRNIPYRLVYQGSEEHRSLPQPRVSLLPTFYLPNEAGEEVAVTDSPVDDERFHLGGERYYFGGGRSVRGVSWRSTDVGEVGR